MVLLTKRRTSKWLLSTSSTSVCVRPWLTCSLKVKIWNGGDQDLLKYVDVGATYYFNKNMSTYVDYKINLLDDNNFTRQAGISTDDVVALGLVYQF
jgi:predicted porin